MPTVPSIFAPTPTPDATNMAAPAQPTASTAAPLGTGAARVGQPAVNNGRVSAPAVPATTSLRGSRGMAPVPVAPVAPSIPIAPQTPNQAPSVAAPVVTPAAPVTPVATAPAVVAPTADTPPPADTAAADQAVTEAAEKARLKVAADTAKKAAEDKVAADKATADAAAAAKAAAATASGVAPVAPTDTPAVAAQKTAAQQTFNDLMAKAQQWMNATEDPASKAAFSKAIIDSALTNQAAMDAAKMQIAQNPALAGQGAGNALLSLRASQLGMADADLRATLSISEQKAVQELNDKGFDAVYKLNELRKTDDDKNLSSYGSVLDEMISGGADEATLNSFFNDHVKPLLPNQGAGMTLDMFRNPSTRAQLLADSKGKTQTLFREAISRKDDLTSIQQLISAGWTDDQLSSIGKDWSKGKSLEEINKGLTDAGFEPVASEADLIGNEDLLGQASLINDAKAQINRAPYQDQADALLSNLTALGYNLTPELTKQATAYAIQESLPGDHSSDVPPWQNDATAYLWDSWPLPGKTSFGNSTIEDTPSTHTVYARNDAIDKAWEQYLSTNPDSSKRVSRQDWYNDLPAGVKDGSTPTDSITTEIAKTSPPKKVVSAGDRTVAANEGKIAAAEAFDKGTTLDLTDPNVAEYIRSLSPTVIGQISNPTTFAKANLGSVVKIGGNIYRVDEGIQGRYATGGSVRHRDVMKLTDANGKTVYMRNDGKTTTIAPPSVSDGDAFRSWYDSIGGA